MEKHFFTNKITFGDIPFLIRGKNISDQRKLLEERYMLTFIKTNEHISTFIDVYKRGLVFIENKGFIGFQTESGIEYFFDHIEKESSTRINAEGLFHSYLTVKIRNKYYLYKFCISSFENPEWIPNIISKQKYFESPEKAKIGIDIWESLLSTQKGIQSNLVN